MVMGYVGKMACLSVGWCGDAQCSKASRTAVSEMAYVHDDIFAHVLLCHSFSFILSYRSNKKTRLVII